MNGFDNAGFAAGSVIGVRWWNLESRSEQQQHTPGWQPVDFDDLAGRSQGLQRLALVGVRAPWLPGENLAKCGNGFPHRVPDEGCGCGHWAYWNVHAAPLYGKRRVMGVIEGYGQVLIGDEGFRCERARLLGLCCQFTETRPTGYAPRYSDGPPPGVRFQGGSNWTGGMDTYRALGGRPYTRDTGQYEATYEEDLAGQVAIETELAERYGVPVYATPQYMLAKHPPTPDYLPADAPGPDWAAICRQFDSPAMVAQLAQQISAINASMAKMAEGMQKFGEAMVAALSGNDALNQLAAKYASWQMNEPLDDGTTIDQALEKIAAPLEPPPPDPVPGSRGIAQWFTAAGMHQCPDCHGPSWGPGQCRDCMNGGASAS